jgi:hypothetical protein
VKRRKDDSPVALMFVAGCFFFAMHVADLLEPFVVGIVEAVTK